MVSGGLGNDRPAGLSQPQALDPHVRDHSRKAGLHQLGLQALVKAVLDQEQDGRSRITQRGESGGSGIWAG
jgi:hypothetical protein